VKSLDEIKADKTYKLTQLQRRLFLVAGCDPACHACKTKIDVGDAFKLVSHKGTDEMCCANCDIPELEVRDKRLQQARKNNQRNERRDGTWGFSRPSAMLDQVRKVVNQKASPKYISDVDRLLENHPHQGYYQSQVDKDEQ
jgi:hypothetical protein